MVTITTLRIGTVVLSPLCDAMLRPVSSFLLHHSHPPPTFSWLQLHYLFQPSTTLTAKGSPVINSPGDEQPNDERHNLCTTAFDIQGTVSLVHISTSSTHLGRLAVGIILTRTTRRINHPPKTFSTTTAIDREHISTTREHHGPQANHN